MQRYIHNYNKVVSHYFLTPAMIQKTESGKKYWLLLDKLISLSSVFNVTR